MIAYICLGLWWRPKTERYSDRRLVIFDTCLLCSACHSPDGLCLDHSCTLVARVRLRAALTIKPTDDYGSACFDLFFSQFSFPVLLFLVMTRSLLPRAWTTVLSLVIPCPELWSTALICFTTVPGFWRTGTRRAIRMSAILPSRPETCTHSPILYYYVGRTSRISVLPKVE